MYATVFLLSIFITTGIIMLEATITVVSALGTIQDSRPRRYIPALLHIRVGVFVVELIMLLVKTVLAAQPGALSDSSNCDDLSVAITVSRILVAITWIIFLGIFLSVLIYIDPCHCYSAKVDFELIQEEVHEEEVRHKKYDTMTESDEKEETTSIQPHLRRRFKVTHTVWEKRFKFMCGCFAGRDEHHEIVYSELAELFATIFCDSNLVLSDIAAGLMLIQKEHIEKERTLWSTVRDSERTSLENFNSEQSVALNFSNHEERKVFEDAVHYLKFALGTYTWPIFMYMNPCGCCQLCRHGLFCPCRQRVPNNVFKDNSCFCGFAGLLSVTGLDESDIIYASFENDLYRAPFVLLLDHSTESVVIAIRGTLSFHDIITDLVATPHEVELPNQPAFHVHKGMYHTAAWVKQKLDDGILEEAFSKVPNYKLVVVGHSLGSGCACLLAILLKEKYSDLTCFCYSPTGSLVNADAAAWTQSFVTSVTIGHDLVARLNVHTAHKLKDDVVKLLRKCKKPKYRIFLEGIMETLGKCCGRHILFKDDDSNSSSPLEERDDLSPLLIPEPFYNSYNTDSEAEASQRSPPSSLSPSPRLYPPGRIIHLVDTMETRGGFFNERFLEARWVSANSFHSISVTPDMLRDHFPDVLSRAMNAVWDDKKDEMTEIRIDSVVNASDSL